MTLTYTLCLAGLIIGLAILAAYVMRQAYRRAHSKVRGPFTRWEDGRG